MIDKFQSIVLALIQPQKAQGDFFVCSASDHFDDQSDNATRVSQSLNAAFLITLSGDSHSDFFRAETYLNRMADSSEWTDVARFYMRATSLVYNEIESVSRCDSDFAECLDSLFKWISKKAHVKDMASFFSGSKRNLDRQKGTRQCSTRQTDRQDHKTQPLAHPRPGSRDPLHFQCAPHYPPLRAISQQSSL